MSSGDVTSYLRSFAISVVDIIGILIPGLLCLVAIMLCPLAFPIYLHIDASMVMYLGWQITIGGICVAYFLGLSVRFVAVGFLERVTQSIWRHRVRAMSAEMWDTLTGIVGGETRAEQVVRASLAMTGRELLGHLQVQDATGRAPKLHRGGVGEATPLRETRETSLLEKWQDAQAPDLNRSERSQSGLGTTNGWTADEAWLARLYRREQLGNNAPLFPYLKRQLRLVDERAWAAIERVEAELRFLAGLVFPLLVLGLDCILLGLQCNDAVRKTIKDGLQMPLFYFGALSLLAAAALVLAFPARRIREVCYLYLWSLIVLKPEQVPKLDSA